MTDAEKLARYDDLANLVDELHDENMELRQQLAERDNQIESLKASVYGLYELEKQLADSQQNVAMLRDALEITHELYTQSSTGYGFARPDNPHNFYPDIDCCSKEEIEAHSKACDDYSSGRNILNCSWGIGTYLDEYVPAIKALAATAPKSNEN